jgi:type I restriction enzyme S subunit
LRYVEPSSLRQHLLRPGDLVLEKSGGGEKQPVGMAVLFTETDTAVCSNFCARIKPSTDVDSRFLTYVFAAAYGQGLTQAAIKQTTGIQNLDTGAFFASRWAFPAQEEQRRIADFLDAETARIDDLAFRQSDQSQLLADRDVSNLSEVYQNLMQEYGSIRLRHILLRIEQGWSPQCDDRQVSRQEWGVVKAGCVNGGIFDPTQHKALPDQVSPRKEYALKEGDLLMSRASGSTELIGSVGIVPKLEHNLLLCDKVYRLSLDSRLGRAEFVARMLRSHMVREHIKMGISGGEGMANNLPIAVVKDCVLPKAPLDVQTSTARKIDRDFSRTARVRNALQRSIKLLAERRQALITAAVTGQFDVSTASGRNVTEGIST